MSAVSKIQWTEATWNVVLGCSKISPGCKHCYAMRVVHRLAHNPNQKVKAANAGLTVIQNREPNWTGKVRLIPERLDIPLKTRKPTTFFVNSLSDLFHEELSDEQIDRVFAAMALCPQHRFQVLTKRSERMEDWARGFGVCESDMLPPFGPVAHLCGLMAMLKNYPLRNVWLGVSVESRDYLHRIDHLRRTPAAVRFLSLEPLLEDLGRLNLEGIHWVIVGGESGKGARPMHPDWARNIQRQCAAAGAAFFFKQWGGYIPSPLPFGHPKGAVMVEGRKECGYYCDEGVGHVDHRAIPMIPVGKKRAGRLLDGRTWDEMPYENRRTEQHG